ncbi:MmcQ/YjbR family DNA-binding protein [Streptomyces sp. ACA25]|uniref:MmcQ/YjbR family DNA-binding protein n=1 Tax=Streptomyces sp. ACA25 TaxID=3022596 RepID=UPI0023080749|nr:MmcQ/YjbR family DNA-binding protein [Streptomyces sp. ACA25]MDB1089758.1 MmcQ/YjbR family DNA-binding protein [Streptomyces sp. ACA25]
MVGQRSVQRTRAVLREFALGLPGAVEEFPWGEGVIKVNKKIFVFLGAEDGHGGSAAVTVKLRDETTHAHALSLPGARPAGYGLGRAGWVRVPLAPGAPPAELLCDWAEESYRAVAPARLVAELDAA